LAIGQLDGTISLSKREVSVQQATTEKKEAQILRAGSHRYFTRGQSVQACEGDFTVESSRKQRLQPYDRFLKRFQYRAALDAALETGHHLVVASVLDELLQRNALNVALGGRNDVSLAPILQFLVKHVTNPRYSSLLIDVSNAILGTVTRLSSPLI
jgi:U3 small nucleolar RNA-associated protein 15